MKNRTVRLVAILIWPLVAAGAAGAHHSAAAEFDATKPIKVTGTLAKVDWANPHVIFLMDVPGDGGTVARWSWELRSPNQLMRAGWTRTSMEVGDRITVEGIHARDGSNHGMATTVILVSTGQRLFEGQAEG